MREPSLNRTLGLLRGLWPLLAGVFGCSLRDFERLGPEQNGGSSGRAGGGGSWGASGFSQGGSDGRADSGAFQPGPDPSRLTNASFENGYNGWLIEPPEAAGVYAFVQWPVTGSTTVDGLNELSTWAESVAFTVRIYQSLSGLEDGEYAFRGHFNFGTGHNAVYLFASGCGGSELRQDVAQTPSTQWAEAELAGIDVSGGGCNVGFVVDANAGNWLNADLFDFERMAVETSSDAGVSP